MMKRRIVSFLLVLVFLLGLCASAYASTEDGGVETELSETQGEAEQEDGASQVSNLPAETQDGQAQDADQGQDADPAQDDGQSQDAAQAQQDVDQSQDAAPQDGAAAEQAPADEQPTADMLPAADIQPAAGIATVAADSGIAPVAEITDGWVRQNGQWFYLKEREKMTGWQTIGNREYYFRTGGSGEWTAQQDVGALAEGLLWLGGKNWYYFDSDSNDPTKTVMVKNGFRNVDGEWSYFGADGKRVSGWQTIGGKQYYFRTDSKNEWSAQEGEYSLAQGLLWLGGKNWYYFDSDSTDPAKTAMVKNGFRNVDGEWSYFGADGKRVTGWQTIGGRKYYFRTSSSREWSAQEGEYSMVEGLLWLGGKNWYYFDGDGSDPTSVNMVKNGFRNVDGEWSYFGADGKRVSGWQTIGGKQYYFRTDSKNQWSAQSGEYSMVSGLLWLGGKNWYYFDGNGSDPASVTMVKNGFRNVDGEWSYFGADGKRVSGWQTIGGRRYYFRTSSSLEWSAQSGEYSMVSGLLWLGGKNWYYFDGDGSDPTSVSMVKSAFRNVDGGISYFNADGKRVTGWQTIGGKKFYFYTSGSREYSMAVGLTQIDGKLYCFDQNQGMLTGWQTIDGKQYYFDGSGVFASGLTWMNDGWYCFDSNGQLLTNTQIALGIKTYTTDSEGRVSGFNGSKQAVDVLNKIGWDLEAAYNWAAGLTYANRSYRADSVDAYADYGFRNGYGNCYVMNSCLYKMAQALGYEVKFMSGAVLNTNGYEAPHGWCEINDGGWYVFDSNFHNETGRNGYRISYGQSGTWKYVKYGYLA